MPSSSGSPLSPRGVETWRIYAANALTAFAVNGLGAVLLPLRADLGVSYAEVAFFPTAYAMATLTTGFFGGAIARTLGPKWLLVTSFSCFVLGAGLFWLPLHALTLVGAVVMGTGAGLTMQAIPTALMMLHGAYTAVAMSESNATASAAAVTAPSLVGAALGMGLGWRFGYLVPLLALSTLLIVLMLRPSRTGTERPAPTPLEATSGRGAVLLPFMCCVLAVSSEFATVFWAAQELEQRFSVAASTAVASVSVFVAGIAAGRILGRGVIRRAAPHVAATIAGLSTLVGFAVFYWAPVFLVGVVGLGIMGLTISILYPILITRVLAAFPGQPEKGSQLGVINNGLSVGVSPMLLALIAEAVGLRLAMLIIPTYIVTLVLLQWFVRGRGAPLTRPR